MSRLVCDVVFKDVIILSRVEPTFKGMMRRTGGDTLITIPLTFDAIGYRLY